MQAIMIKYPIGIDIGAKHLSAAQLKRQGKGLAVRGLYYGELNNDGVDLSPADDAAMIARLKEVAKHKSFSGRTAVLSIPSKNLFIFPLRIQAGRQETLEEAILRESAKYLPFPIEEAVIDYPSLTQESGGDPDSYRATIVAARQSDISAYLSLLKQAGFVVEAVDFAVSSLFRLHRSLWKTTDNPLILCHIGHTKSLLAAVTGDSILVQSDVAWGSRKLISSLLSDFDLSDNQGSARVLLKRYGLGFEGTESVGKDSAGETTDVSKTIFRIIVPYVDEIIYELHKIISYVRSEKQNPLFDGIFLYGQASCIHHLDRYLEKRLSIPVTIVDPLMTMSPAQSQVPLKDSAEGMFALALGLAMRRMPWL